MKYRLIETFFYIGEVMAGASRNIHEDKVNAAIEEGWRSLGGIMLTAFESKVHTRDRMVVYTQAMTWEDNNDRARVARE